MMWILMVCLGSCVEEDDLWEWDFDDKPKEIVWDELPIHDVIVVGSGPAGGTAAIYLARAGLRTLVLHGPRPGGQLTETTEIANFPGFKGTGTDLVMTIQDQATRAGAEFALDEVRNVTFVVGDHRLQGEAGYRARSVVIATGANPKWLGLPNEERLRNHGVSACAVCDGALYAGEDVVVVGGGDSAVEEALYLARRCRNVTLIHRRGELRASAAMRAALDASNVTVVFDSVLADVLGEAFVTGVEIQNLKTNKVREVAVAAVFVAIGRAPATEAFAAALKLEPDGLVWTSDGTQTSVGGVFAAGDVADRTFRQAVTAAGGGCRAALRVMEYLRGADAAVSRDDDALLP